MFITALGVTLLFVSLGLATALLAAVHDAIEALVQRRRARAAAVVYASETTAPKVGPAPRRSSRRNLPVVVSASAPAKSAYVVEPTPVPAWLDMAHRDMARRNLAYTNTNKPRRSGK